MKKSRLVLITLFVAGFAVSLLAGCSSPDTQTSAGGSSASAAEGSSASAEAPDPAAAFSYSDGIDENGYIEGIKALDYVEMFTYKGFAIPDAEQQVTDEDVQAQIDAILSSFSTTQEVDRPAQDGDTLNIDYVGSVDGVEFEGGSTGGAGTDVTIGTTSYVDDFIAQLIGHNTGDAFDITVTFPENYGNEELNGKDAVFAITINSISEAFTPELTDAFVAENLAANYQWTTVEEMKDGVSKDIRDAALRSYVQNYLTNDVAVSSVPESLIAYQEKAFVKYYETYAASYGVSIEEFLPSYVGVASVDELVAQATADLKSSASYLLVIQAIAEDSKMVVTDEEVSDYFLKYMGNADYSPYETEYGLPHLKQTVLGQKVLDMIIENAVFE